MQSIRDLILADAHLNEYYTYHGSLTTPPCSEVVTWIDFKQSIPLSHAQVHIRLIMQKEVKLKECQSESQKTRAARTADRSFRRTAFPLVLLQYDMLDHQCRHSTQKQMID